MINILPDQFLFELFALSLNNRAVLDVIIQHLKFEYLPDERFKDIYKEITKQVRHQETVPTIGTLKNTFREHEYVLEVLTDIKDVDLSKIKIDTILTSFQSFIKQNKFVALNDELVQLYHAGKKEQAYAILAKGSEEITNFSIRDKMYDKVFDQEQFASRFVERVLRANTETGKGRKIPTGIDEFDLITGGGPEKGELFIHMAPSGVGKSQLAIHLGIAGARRGFTVFHYQCEGTRSQILDRYDAAWTGSLYQDIKIGEIGDSKLIKCKKVISEIGKGQIFIEVAERFNSRTIGDFYSSFLELKKLVGEIDEVIIDYGDLLDPDDGHSYKPSEERFRQTKVRRRMKDIAVQEDVLIHDFTQTSDIDPEHVKDPNFVITRHYLAEDKGKLRPADGLVSLNQTPDEKKEGRLRLHFDKLREYTSGQTISIVSTMDRSRFYDRRKTLALLQQLEEEGLYRGPLLKHLGISLDDAFEDEEEIVTKKKRH